VVVDTQGFPHKLGAARSSDTRGFEMLPCPGSWALCPSIREERKCRMRAVLSVDLDVPVC
jgi:hypothetical protein